MTDPVVLVLLIALGTWAALDGVSLGQIMISRPLVSGTLAGSILGDPDTGIFVGAILEAAHLGMIPAGGARLPEPGPAAVPAVFAAVLLGGPVGILVGAGIGGGMSLLGGSSVIAQRTVNGALTRGFVEGHMRGAELALRHWLCIGVDGLRGAALTTAGLILAGLVAAAAHGRLDEGSLGLWVLFLPGAVAGGALLRSWTSGPRRIALYLFGLLGGWFFAASVSF